MQRYGALPSQLIKELVQNGFVKGVTEESNIRPGSLDPSITGEVFRVNGVFLPAYNETVKDAIKRVGGIQLKGEKILLEKGCVYALRLNETIDHFPANIYAYCNPKSSSGRVDAHVRLLVDKLSRYDAIESGYSGPMWLLVVPKTFPIIVSPGLTLNQIRFCNSDTRLDELSLEVKFNANGGLLFDHEGQEMHYKKIHHTDKDGSILLTLGLHFPSAGFEAVENGEPIDLSLRKHYDPKYFFREVIVSNNSLVLRAGTFYILSTKESVRVPANLACEMRPMDERSGDLRSHYAGFIDPGWGVGADNHGRGRPLTLEVRSFDNGIIVRDGQPIAKIRYERMLENPTQHYDEMDPTYGSQNGPKLGKYFSEWK